MALISMTGFARAEAQHDGLLIQIEARCVNGRSSDIKLRLPSGLDRLDKPVRALFQKAIRRGNANITVSLQRETTRLPRINDQTLDALRSALVKRAQEWGQEPPKLADMLDLPGVLEMVDPAALDDTNQDEQDAAILACATICANDLSASRAAEGVAMHAVLDKLIDTIEQEVGNLAAHPDAKGAHLFSRLKTQIDQLLDGTSDLDAVRLHQEAALLVTKADIEEELSRLRAHVDAAKTLLDESEPTGRRLDFLAQEFNREANTICSKASSIAITQSGLALKALIDQVKEQVQNVE
ncbi:MAG: YicC family protein [Hyphomicrobiales bacterium]